ncbi:MAG: rhodanese-like domain-containing protein [Bacteroidia bacterium]|nr:rhodanese-like domain-containing protein [Bacteroidia bacterium]
MAFKNLAPIPYKEGFSTEANSVLIDVRTAAEFEEGHIPGAINIDIQSPDFREKVEGLDKTKNYYINCRSGGRSSMACNYFSQNGFEGNLYNLDGGMLAWSASNLEVEE